MIDRLRKDLDKVGNSNPGMAAGGEVHSDEPQDAAMIESVLQKIIDEMHGMEAGRIHPKIVDAKVTAIAPKPDAMSMGGMAKPNENIAETNMEAEPENQENQHGELDPDVLKSLLDKAGSADASGATPEDGLDDIHPGLADIIRNKKKPV